MKKLHIATRKSPLALWQANFVANQLKLHWPEMHIELVPMVTSGDQFLKDKLLAAGGKGLFVKELEEAILAGRADIAVHSMKDVPADFPAGLHMGVICARHSPRDAFISRAKHTVYSLLPGSLVGTSSLRRQSQLLAIRPDLKVKTLRGNVNTRLAKLDAGEFDAIILAESGLERLGMQDLINEILSEEDMLPACGQGALGIECRQDNQEIQALLAPLHDSLSALCVHSERYVNKLLGGNCHIPLAVFCKPLSNQEIILRAKVLTADGQTVIYDEQSGPQSQAMTLAEICAKNLLAKGAQELLAQSI